jgi:REP element-mobilizing transposase RayT
MPRQSRIDAPGALHHVLIRGIERRKIFKDDADRENFLERLGGILVETSTACYGWALLPNHVHLLLRTGTVPIGTVMARLLAGYVVSFNRRHRRHGYLFQNRYKSSKRGEKISRDRTITVTDTRILIFFGRLVSARISPIFHCKLRGARGGPACRSSRAFELN